MPSSTRQTKRPFQPSITSFFARDDRDDFLACLDFERPSRDELARLPPQIQSSLLNVGMRVRKSVPEGYKTGSMFCGLGLPLDSSVCDGPAMLKDDEDVPELDFGRHGGTLTNATTSTCELTPFCGILKTGGLSLQTLNTGPIQRMESSSQNDPFELYTSSQSSLESEAPRLLASNKRRYEDTPDDAYAPFIFDDGLDLQPVSPRSRPVSHTRMPNLNSIRQFAVPKSRRRCEWGGKDGGGGGVGDEENYPRRGAVVGMDFGNAEFLQPEDLLEDHGEIEMGGV